MFYKKNNPVRLLVIDKNTNVENCIFKALNQYLDSASLKDLYSRFNVQSTIIDMKEQAKDNLSDRIEEIDVGSCDRWKLLYNMLQGIYTENNDKYGNFIDNKYYFVPNLFVKYELTTDDEKFEIVHKCAFLNVSKTRLIPIQENSSLTK